MRLEKNPKYVRNLFTRQQFFEGKNRIIPKQRNDLK